MSDDSIMSCCMTITPDVEKFLKSAGYKYYCFISWPHTRNRELTECAKRLKSEIENGLRIIVNNPEVFIDEDDLIVGDKWENVIPKALCQSITMVAMCAPIYFNSSAHKWCSWEWAGMEILSKKRLLNEDFSSVIPVIIKECKPLPHAVSSIQYIDFTKVMDQGRRYYTTHGFRKKLNEIIDHIQKVAICIAEHNIKAEWNKFKIPKESIFSDYNNKKQTFPFRKA